MTIKFYHTTNNPTGLQGTVGGPISTETYTGTLGELFAYIETPPSGSDTGISQYRKLHIKNDDSVTYTGVHIWLYEAEHSEQVSIGLEASADQTIPDPTGTAPTSVTFSAPTDYANGINVGSLAPGASTGIWIKTYLSGIVEPDPYATCHIMVGFYESS